MCVSFLATLNLCLQLNFACVRSVEENGSLLFPPTDVDASDSLSEWEEVKHIDVEICFAKQIGHSFRSRIKSAVN